MGKYVELFEGNATLTPIDLDHLPIGDQARGTPHVHLPQLLTLPLRDRVRYS
jgi:hypothetical protein